MITRSSVRDLRNFLELNEDIQVVGEAVRWDLTAVNAASELEP